MIMKNDSNMNHEQALLDLPWYVNGTLDASDKQRVSECLRESDECRRELDRVRGVHAVIEQTAPAAVDVDQAWSRMQQRIAAQPPHRAHTNKSVTDSLFDWLGQIFNQPKLAAAFAMLLVLITSSDTVFNPQQVDDRYRVLSSGESSYPSVFVNLDQNADAAQTRQTLDQLLLDSGVRGHWQQSSANAYVLTLESESLSGDELVELGQLLQTLNTLEGVVESGMKP